MEDLDDSEIGCTQNVLPASVRFFNWQFKLQKLAIDYTSWCFLSLFVTCKKFACAEKNIFLNYNVGPVLKLWSKLQANVLWTTDNQYQN